MAQLFTTVIEIDRQWRAAAKTAPMDADVETRCKWMKEIAPEYVRIELPSSEDCSHDRIFEVVVIDRLSAGVLDFVNAVFPDVNRNSCCYAGENTREYVCKINVYVDQKENPTYTDCGSIA